MNKLLVAAVVLVIAKDAVPYGIDAWQRHRLEQSRQRYFALKDREIQCLERLLKGGVEKAGEVERRIAACKQLGIDPETGRPVTFR